MMLKPPISPRFASVMLCLWMLTSIAPVFSKAFFEEGEEPLEIQSDAADFQESRGEATYKGQVSLRQGDRYLSAETLVIHRKPDRKIDRITATGQPAHFEIQSASQQAPIYGEANTIKYFSEGNKVILRDQAQLKQEGRSIQGPYLTYYLDQQTLLSEPVEGQQTKVILQNKGR